MEKREVNEGAREKEKTNNSWVCHTITRNNIVVNLLFFFYKKEDGAAKRD